MVPLTKEALDAAEGLSGALMLAFTFLVWMFFLAILLANPRNKLNRWGFAGGMVLSVGVLKEYLYYNMGPMLMELGYWSEAFSEGLYSVLSAIFYYCAMPTTLIFSFYFARLDVRCPKWFSRLRIMAFLPAAVFFLAVPCWQTRQYQFIPAYCLAAALYNCIYAVIFSILLVRTLYAERLTAVHQQRSMAAMCILIPMWYWILSGFPWHIFGVTSMLKAWQGNLLVIALMLAYYLFHVFRDGIWGIRLRHENYDWAGDRGVLQKNAQFMGHALKNELAKIEWCVSLMRDRGRCDHELEIIQRSTEHLRGLVERTHLYSADIVLSKGEYAVEKMLHDAVGGLPQQEGKRLDIRIAACDSTPLCCDRTHICEVLRNLLINAADAVEDGGRIELAYRTFRRRAELTVKDTGCGIAADALPKLFEPYFTSKSGNQNMGLGLYYCWNVMNAHGGHIQVRSAPGQGSAFMLVFPVERKWRKKEEAV